MTQVQAVTHLEKEIHSKSDKYVLALADISNLFSDNLILSISTIN